MWVRILNKFDRRFWREQMIQYLDIWSMLSYIQINKKSNKEKQYVYNLIIQNIFSLNIDEMKTSFELKTSYNFITSRIIYNIDYVVILVMHNKTIRKKIAQYIERGKYSKKKVSCKHRYNTLNSILKN
tara:strand:+ start:1030 stop:1413 length:384 start_codon:yes stop_codon:yes gene_type:complete